MIFKPAQEYIDQNKMPSGTIDHAEEADWFSQLLWAFFDGPPNVTVEHDIYDMTGDKYSIVTFKERNFFQNFLQESAGSDSLYELGNISPKFDIKDCIIDVGHSDMSIKVKGWVEL